MVVRTRLRSKKRTTASTGLEMASLKMRTRISEVMVPLMLQAANAHGFILVAPARAQTIAPGKRKTIR